MRSTVMSLLRSTYPVYRPVLSRLGMLDVIARKYPSDKRLHGYIPHYRRHFHPWRGRRIKLLENRGGPRRDGRGSVRVWANRRPARMMDRGSGGRGS